VRVKTEINLFKVRHKVIICRDFVGKKFYISVDFGYSITLHSSYMHELIVGTESQ